MGSEMCIRDRFRSIVKPLLFSDDLFCCRLVVPPLGKIVRPLSFSVDVFCCTFVVPHLGVF